jgi:ribonuclease T2
LGTGECELQKILATLLIVLFVAGVSDAKQRHYADNTPGAFDYYLLNLSWAPAYCSANAGHASSSECDPAHHFGFVVHGLWPQNNDGSYPQNCSPASPVSQSIVQHMLPIMPERGLIQHEWARHGTCTGLASQEYFGEIETAFRKIQIPADYRNPKNAVNASPAEIEQKFAQANNAPFGAFRVVCSRELDVEVCLTKDLQFRVCGERLRDCSAGQVTLPALP